MALSWTLQPSDKLFSFKFCQLTRVKQILLLDEKLQVFYRLHNRILPGLQKRVPVIMLIIDLFDLQ